MRIACIHVPQFALQCATRLDPSLRGAPVAVVSGGEPGERSRPLHAPVVTACSRAAWALGVRLGMTATSARGLAPALRLVSAESLIERETVRAICDAVLGVSGVVDAGGRIGPASAHLAIYAEVPAKTRGQTFGDRVLDLLDELGIVARVGIADDRFTAWVAAAYGAAGARATDDHERSVVSVPRGGSAAFLSPRPLSLLAIPAEVQHMLESLGVRTLGEFAALPAPSVARPFEADYQALARGESGTRLTPWTPDAPIREDVLVSGGNVLEAPGSVGGPAAVELVARRIALRLAGRARAAARIEITARGGGVKERELSVTLDHPATDELELVHVLAPVLEGHDSGGWRIEVEVVGEALVGDAAGVAVSPLSAEGSGRMMAAHVVDPLSVVLSTAGSLFSLSPPDRAAERREHRRTRRGKQRRIRPIPMAQSKLFERG
jgi:hypothetical protein